MTSLRFKLTAALLGMSFVAIAAVGTMARLVVMERFDAFVVERAAAGFTSEVAEYYEVHGSFEAAVARESFFDFLERARPQLFREAPGQRQGAGAPPRPGEGSQTGRPPQPGRLGPAGAGQPLPGEQAPQRAFAFGGSPPAFGVVDENGAIVIPLAGYEVGESVPEELLSDAIPILSNGVEIARAFPLERPLLTEVEERYLRAVQDAWLWGLLVATGIAVPIGLILGSRLARPIHEVAEAMGRMQTGELRQSVPVRSSDELGVLADRFNQMSTELADAQLALEESQARLDAHAKAMTELSRSDTLTGIPNRRSFNEKARMLIAQARRYERPLTVAMIDLDHFKKVNDDHSHAVGDAVLRRAATILTGNLREVDVVARWGGEEFVVAFPDTELEDAAALAERLRETFQQHEWSDLGEGLTVTASMGLAQLNGEAGLEPLLQRADEMLYRAKDQGRNRIEHAELGSSEEEAP